MMDKKINMILTNILASILVMTVSLSASAEMAADEVARLGVDLTPLGGEKAGNAAGTIPAWDGGLTQAPSGYTEGGYYVDPYSGDAIKFTITSGNMGEHADKLTEGHKALLKTYPDSFKMNVYPTHRSAAAPQHIYDATKQIAGGAKLTADGNGVDNAIVGIPFPVPSNGLEAIWNHILRWRAGFAERKIAQAAPTRGGSYTLVQFSDQFNLQYNREGMTLDQLNNIILYFKQEVKAPARLAGGILLVHETLNQKAENRKAWLYNPGLMD